MTLIDLPTCWQAGHLTVSGSRLSRLMGMTCKAIVTEKGSEMAQLFTVQSELQIRVSGCSNKHFSDIRESLYFPSSNHPTE